MSDETERENLAEAEAWLARIVDGFRPPMETSMDKAATIQDEYDRLRAELARLRPVVEAAEALVETWDQAPAASRERASEVFDDHADDGLGDRIDVLAEKVKEAQR